MVHLNYSCLFLTIHVNYSILSFVNPKEKNGYSAIPMFSLYYYYSKYLSKSGGALPKPVIVYKLCNSSTFGHSKHKVQERMMNDGTKRSMNQQEQGQRPEKPGYGQKKKKARQFLKKKGENVTR